MLEKICKNCGSIFYVDREHRGRRHCCDDCRRESYKKLQQLKNTQVTKICEYCGKEFKVLNCRKDKAKYCSKFCANEAIKLLNLNYVCPICGKMFHIKPYQVKKYGHSLGHYCSVECLNKAKSIFYSGEGNHQFGLKGPLNSSFVGEVSFSKNHSLTEKMIYRPNHPLCNNNGRVKEHRLIVEENYFLFSPKYFFEKDGKMYLKKEIHVHHIDGNHNNNVINNLMPCTAQEHRMYHKSVILERNSLGRIVKTAVLKQGELLGNLEVDNQQPSLPLTKQEGSETNS